MFVSVSMYVSVCVCGCVHVCNGFSLDLTDMKWCILLGQKDDVTIQTHICIERVLLGVDL